MKNNINLCIVAGTHGDEYGFGSLVQEFVDEEMPGQAYMLNANPLASGLGVRYVDSDLNRSFDGSGKGNESELVEQIRDVFNREQFTHVVDLHTSATTHGIVPILPSQCQGERADDVIKTNFDIKRIVELLPATPYSLVAAFGQGGIALECPRYRYKQNAKQVANGLLNLLKGAIYEPSPRKIYKMTGLIPVDVELPFTPMEDFEEIPPYVGGLSFVADPAIYKRLGYGHQGMVVELNRVVRM